MADQRFEPKTRIETLIARAGVFWRWLIGLLISVRDHAKAFVEWAADEKPSKGKPWLTKAQWEELRDVAQSLPLVILKLCICAGLILNLCRSQVEATPTADPLDGAALVATELPQIQGWFWLAALWLILSVVEKVVKSITVNIVSRA